MSDEVGILWFVLDQQSSERLRQVVPPRYPNEFYHHVTLQYGVTRQAVESFIDKPWSVNAYAVVHDQTVQACRVDTNGLPDSYGVPHVTLSTAVGIKPFASVAMLQGEHKEEPIEPFEITGTVEFELLRNITE